MYTQDLGNNEQQSRGLIEINGQYLALLFHQSRWFKRRSAAVKWLAKHDINPDGTRIT